MSNAEAERPTVLETLHDAEAATVLARLVADQPELAEPVERIGAELLGAGDRDASADQLVAAFLATPFTAIANRVGRRRGGYVEEAEAASEVLEETLQPFCDDLRRRARSGFTDAATELGLGLLAGLYRLPDEADPDSLIGWCETEQEAWELATSVILAFDDAGLEVAPAVVNDLVPGWAGLAG